MIRNSTAKIFTCLAMVPLLAPNCAWGATTSALKHVDLQLSAQGVVHGQVFDRNGRPEAGGLVEVMRQGRVVAKAKADVNGRFRLKGLAPGTCQFKLLTATQNVRLWANGAAPPKSASELLIVSGPLTERGQRELSGLLTNPLVIGLVIAAAVSIPLATHDNSGS